MNNLTIYTGGSCTKVSDMQRGQNIHNEDKPLQRLTETVTKVSHSPIFSNLEKPE